MPGKLSPDIRVADVLYELRNLAHARVDAADAAGLLDDAGATRGGHDPRLVSRLPHPLPPARLRPESLAVLGVLGIAPALLEFPCCGYPLRHQSLLASVLSAARAWPWPPGPAAAS